MILPTSGRHTWNYIHHNANKLETVAFIPLENCPPESFEFLHIWHSNYRNASIWVGEKEVTSSNELDDYPNKDRLFMR